MSIGTALVVKDIMADDIQNITGQNVIVVCELPPNSHIVSDVMHPDGTIQRGVKGQTGNYKTYLCSSSNGDNICRIRSRVLSRGFLPGLCKSKIFYKDAEGNKFIGDEIIAPEELSINFIWKM